jgi:peptide-methionine (S)-S-oxide reductase
MGAACSKSYAAADVPAPAQDQSAEQVTVGEDGLASIVLAGGCFWCTEAVFEPIDGVQDVVSGYAGGDAANANYQAVSAGQTEHAEVIRVSYDPQLVTLGRLLHVFFSVAHDPTQVDRQGPDVGSQYRSAIFYADDAQRQVAQAYITQLNEAGVYDRPIATTLEPLEQFHPAERYHQDYVVNNPSNPYVRAHAVPKVNALEQHHPELIDGEPGN